MNTNRHTDPEHHTSGACGLVVGPRIVSPVTRVRIPSRTPNVLQSGRGAEIHVQESEEQRVSDSRDVLRRLPRHEGHCAQADAGQAQGGRPSDREGRNEFTEPCGMIVVGPQHYASVAQMVERWSEVSGVGGSTPPRGTKLKV